VLPRPFGGQTPLSRRLIARVHTTSLAAARRAPYGPDLPPERVDEHRTDGKPEAWRVAEHKAIGRTDLGSGSAPR
jgi:hypothetical protein